MTIIDVNDVKQRIDKTIVLFSKSIAVVENAYTNVKGERDIAVAQRDYGANLANAVIAEKDDEIGIARDAYDAKSRETKGLKQKKEYLGNEVVGLKLQICQGINEIDLVGAQRDYTVKVSNAVIAEMTDYVKIACDVYLAKDGQLQKLQKDYDSATSALRNYVGSDRRREQLENFLDDIVRQKAELEVELGAANAVIAGQKREFNEAFDYLHNVVQDQNGEIEQARQSIDVLLDGLDKNIRDKISVEVERDKVMDLLYGKNGANDIMVGQERQISDLEIALDKRDEELEKYEIAEAKRLSEEELVAAFKNEYKTYTSGSNADFEQCARSVVKVVEEKGLDGEKVLPFVRALATGSTAKKGWFGRNVFD